MEGSTPFSNVTAAFTHKEWRHLVRAPRKGFEEIPEKSRNLVLLGLRFPAWYQLPAGTREKPMDAGGRRPKEYLSSSRRNTAYPRFPAACFSFQLPFQGGPGVAHTCSNSRSGL
ncbi:uncharacterized protein LOC106695812 isoform X2 [Myotis lucifugus]|uniref:uncharacterized protein LOC106695812 isoform X2 n=1 Tax=Myotis lucifugus TaxID=59463 RepID=UPI000CCC1251|nr:uncharacterized protein LOC106695812 isoform X2 [Myotis lucifugus]